MRKQLARAAASPTSLHVSVWLNALAAFVTAVAANWAIAQGHIDWRWWLIGNAILAGAVVVLHHFSRRARGSEIARDKTERQP